MRNFIFTRKESPRTGAASLAISYLETGRVICETSYDETLEGAIKSAQQWLNMEPRPVFDPMVVSVSASKFQGA